MSNNQPNGLQNRGIRFSDVVFIIFVVLSCGSFISFNGPVYIDDYYECKFYTSTSDLFSYSESIYIYLMKFFASQELEYKYFILLLLGVGFLLIHTVARRYLGNNAWLFYLLFFIYPLGESRSTIRNTVALCIMTYVIPFLSNDDLKSKIKYIIGVIIAMGFHQTAVIYFVLLLKYPYESLSSINKKRANKLFIIGISVLVAACFIPAIMEPLKQGMDMVLAGSELDESRGNYFEEQGRFGFLLYGGWQCVFIYMLRRLLAIRICHDKDFVGTPIYRFVNNVILCSSILLFMVFFYKMNNNFFRIFMNIIPLNYIALLALNQNGKYGIMYKDFKVIACIIIVLTLGWNDTLIYLDENIMPMFTDNWLLSLDF